MKAHWDALEAVLERLSDKRFLYVLGCFNFEGDWSSDESKRLVFSRDKTLLRGRPMPGWSGVYGPCSSRQELHGLLAANLNEFHYFLIVDEPLEPKSALGLYKEADRGEWGRLYQEVCRRIEHPYCGIAEARDRDCVGLQCRAGSLAEIWDILSRTLAEFGLELTADANTRDDGRRGTEY